ncbi:MAG: hypothetical protein HYZ00_13580, partial [Candidatus Hydrogenedentes bacterium]|nr:hypothetical protein [Candidatus Hydrogenedentota bacterium]
IEITPMKDGQPLEGFPAQRLERGAGFTHVTAKHNDMVEGNLAWGKPLPEGTVLRCVLHRAKLMELARPAVVTSRRAFADATPVE